MKSVILPYKMMFRGKPPTAAVLLILVVNIFRGHSLTCHQTEYQNENVCCRMCPAGSRVKTDCTEFRSTSCLPCIERTFMNHPTGHKQCFRCTNCDAGSGLKIKTSCTPTSDTVCEPLEGFYCVDSTEDGCVAAQKHTRCQPGQYIRQSGTAFTDTVCSDCSAGTFSDGTFPSCQPHTQCESVMKPGTASSDAECGEKSSVTTVPVIAVVVVVVVLVLFLLIGASVWYYLRKKRRCLSTGGNTKADNPKPAAEESSGMLQTDIDDRIPAAGGDAAGQTNTAGS